MKVNQIAVFLQNKPGCLGDICRTLADANVNIVTLSLADTQQFGILRLLVPDWKNTAAILEKAGFVVQVSEVVAAEIDDKPGGMSRVVDIVTKAGVNIEYAYAFTAHSGADAVLIFRFDNTDAAVAALDAAGVKTLSDVELLRSAK